jgi:hypothetical protein
MTYFEDLSKYSYFGHGSSEALNVGWVEETNSATAVPSPEILDRLWEHCKVAVEQTRGFHICHLCPEAQRGVVYASRNGLSLNLGSAEIRAISADGRVYAAPNLVYHYVHTHRYDPPEEFKAALRAGLSPKSEGYFEMLKALGLDWKVLSPEPAMGQGGRTGSLIESLQRVDAAFRVFREEI